MRQTPIRWNAFFPVPKPRCMTFLLFRSWDLPGLGPTSSGPTPGSNMLRLATDKTTSYRVPLPDNRTETSGTTDGNPCDEHQHAADYYLKRSRQQGRIHILVPNPRNRTQLKRHHNHCGYEC